MTHNSVQYMANLEDRRHNLAAEAENRRHNKAMEAENARSDLANEAIGRSNAKANRSNAKTNRLQYRRQSKDSRVQRSNTRAETAKTRRATQHYDVEEAQGWTDLSIKKLQTAIESRYKDRMASVNEEKNVIQKERNYNDLLIAAFKDPKLLAYLGLTGKIDTKEVSKKIKKGISLAEKAGVTGYNAYKSYILPLFTENPKPLEKFFDVVTNTMEDLTLGKIKFKQQRSKTHMSKRKKFHGGTGGKF